MTVDKNISIDLARVQPHRIVKIHEGDVNSVFVVLSVTNGGASVALKDKTIKYDATIAGYLAEQDADGSVDDDNTIRIPVTSNMTATSGTLKIDVKIKEDDEVLFTQTITLIVEKAVINDSTIIDLSGITIAQRFNELDESVDSLNNAINEMDSNLENYASLANESKASVIDLKQVSKGQYYFSEERGVIGIKTSEATDISSETAPTYIEAYTTDKIDDMLGDVESLLAQI